jgi:integrase
MAHVSAQDGTRSGTRTARETARTDRLVASLPDGIALGVWRDGRGKPFFVRYGPSRKVESFALEADRNDRAEKLWEAQRAQGEQILDFDHGELAEWQRFKAQTGASLEQLRTLWVRFGSVVAAKTLTREAVASYLAFRVSEGIAPKSDTYRHVRKALQGCLCDALGELRLSEVTAPMLRDLLATLRTRDRKGAASDTTKRNYRKDWNTFFQWAVRETLIQQNPCQLIAPPKLVHRDRPVLALPDVFRFFQTARNSPIGARLAVEAFAGLRVSSSARLAEDEIHREEGGIVLPASKHKLEKRFFVDGFPGNVFEWLDLPDQRWDISESTYNQYKSRCFLASGVKNMGNVLRHSFCTYHIAAYRNAAQTATLLTHHNASTLYQHYRGRGVAHAQGLAYFLITPRTVRLTFEEFLAYAHTTQRTQSNVRANAPRDGRTGGALAEAAHPENDLGRTERQGSDPQETGDDPQGGEGSP